MNSGFLGKSIEFSLLIKGFYVCKARACQWICEKWSGKQWNIDKCDSDELTTQKLTRWIDNNGAFILSICTHCRQFGYNSWCGFCYWYSCNGGRFCCCLHHWHQLFRCYMCRIQYYARHYETLFNFTHTKILCVDRKMRVMYAFIEWIYCCSLN